VLPPDAPLALVTKAKGALRLHAVNAQAQALGLIPGLTLADARARVPDLEVADWDEAADAALLERLARACLDWTPLVTPVPPDTIILDIAGTEHLHGGEAALMQRITSAMAARGLTVRIAGAMTAAAARALAHHAALPVTDERAAIRALPVAALDLAAEAELALRRAGLSSIGAVAQRSSASIAARFGMAAVIALRRLLGEETAPIVPLPHVAPLDFVQRFAEPIGDQAAIAASLHGLLGAAARTLSERGVGGRRFVLTMCRSDDARSQLVIETGQPTRDPALVLRLFDERIAALADPLDPGFGYDSIGLAVPVAEPLADVQPTLDGSEQNAALLAELIDRLSTRLGAGSLRRLVPQDRHVPEQAQLALPAVHCAAPARWPAPVPGEPPLRPLFLFDPPQPLEVIAEVPDGPPHRFRWKRKLHEVRLYEGPERIAAEWWQREGGEHGAGEHAGAGGLTRDYFRVEDARGRRFWLFRHGLYEEKTQPQWYMHGLFA
jgi:protein ImuB